MFYARLPHDSTNRLVEIHPTSPGCTMVVLPFGSISLGRHLGERMKPSPFRELRSIEVTPSFVSRTVDILMGCAAFQSSMLVIVEDDYRYGQGAVIIAPFPRFYCYFYRWTNGVGRLYWLLRGWGVCFEKRVYCWSGLNSTWTLGLVEGWVGRLSSSELGSSQGKFDNIQTCEKCLLSARGRKGLTFRSLLTEQNTEFPLQVYEKNACVFWLLCCKLACVTELFYSWLYLTIFREYQPNSYLTRHCGVKANTLKIIIIIFVHC